jgi:hypothetical protein
VWLAALWTGAGVAVVCATAAIVAVAVLWLPVAGTGSHAGATIRAGLLTFLAALHGGVTIDGEQARFLPLGLLLIVAVVAYRAGLGLADAAGERGESDPARLVLAFAVQCAGFAACCLAAVPFAGSGTSDAPFVGVGLAAILLFTAAGGAGLVRASPLRERWAVHLPAGTDSAVRGAAALSCVYLAAGAVLVAASLAVHHARVQQLSAQVGGGWSGVPLLLLGMLSAPNAVVAGAAYLAGPGFAVGTGVSVNALAGTSGVVPALPLLGALPDGAGANIATLALLAGTPLAGGLVLARLAAREPSWAARLRVVGAAAGVTALGWALLGWQAGGGIGSGRLRTVGASAWQLGPAVGVPAAVVACAALGLTAALGARGAAVPPLRALSPRSSGAGRAGVRASGRPAPGEDDELAG